MQYCRRHQCLQSGCRRLTGERSRFGSWWMLPGQTEWTMWARKRATQLGVLCLTGFGVFASGLWLAGVRPADLKRSYDGPSERVESHCASPSVVKCLIGWDVSRRVCGDRVKLPMQWCRLVR